jgi:hypothetical protein
MLNPLWIAHPRFRLALILTSTALVTSISAPCLALQLPNEGAFQVKTQELSINGEVLVKNALPTNPKVAVPRSEIICIKLPSDWEKTMIWTGSYRVNCFNGSFDEFTAITRLKTQCGTLAKNTVYEVEQKQEGASFSQTETEKKDGTTTITKVIVRPFGKC